MHVDADRYIFNHIFLYIHTYNLLGNQDVHLAIFIHARNLYAHGVTYGVRL